MALFAEAGLGQPAPPRSTELTLARIQPGKDTLETAKKHLREGYAGTSAGKPEEKVAEWAFWDDSCGHAGITAQVDEDGLIQSVAVFLAPWMMGDCFEDAPKPPLYSRWMTGKGLRLGYHKTRAIALYGEPYSTEVTKKGSERLLFLFDGARDEEPRVLEVLCNPQSGIITHMALYTKKSRRFAELKARGIQQ